MFGIGLPELIIILIILAILLIPTIFVIVIVFLSQSKPKQPIQSGGVMFCTKCGKENEANATHCVECGEAMTFAQPQAAASTAQPQAAPSASGQPTQVPNYLVQAILVTIFCCLPFGIVAIVFAAQVNGKLQAGDINGAMESSRKAKMWSWLGFGIGLAFAILYAVFILLVGVGSQL